MTTYNLIHDANGARAAGMVSFAGDCGDGGLLAVAQRAYALGKPADDPVKAATRLRARILRDAERAGDVAAYVQVKAVRPSDLAWMLERMGTIVCTTSTGTYAAMFDCGEATDMDVLRAQGEMGRERARMVIERSETLQLTA